jgi:bifunctional DNA-binding transcriptional regulator/antitoxin component of YhaV-PrlF toxin-antitoxin module
MVKLQENKHRWFVSIPKQYVKYLGWEKGQEILITLDTSQGYNQLKLVEYPKKKKEVN